jgi:putative transposase
MFPSVGPVRRSGSTARRNGRSRALVTRAASDRRYYRACLAISRYGYRKIAELLRQAGWTINDKRVECIWQREGLKVPHKQVSPASSRRST